MNSPSRPLAHSLPDIHILKGFLLLAAGLLLFSCMDTATKYLTETYNAPSVVAIRYLVHCALMIVILAPRHASSMVNTQRTGLSLLRALSLVFASIFIALALQRMPLAETTAINFLSPILIALFASFFLGDRIGLFGWLTVSAGFIGVLLIARPGGGLDMWGILFALGAAIANAIYQMFSRTLASTEKAVTLLFYSALVGSIIYGLMLPFFWEGITPTHSQLIAFFSMGACGGLGHYLFTLAYRYAPTSVLAPMTYLQLVWASLLGFVFFGTLPDAWGFLGMLIIVLSGVAIASRSRFRKKAE